MQQYRDKLISLLQEKGIKHEIESCSLVIKLNDLNSLYILTTRGYIPIREGSKFINLMKKYENIELYCNLVDDDIAVHISGAKCDNPDIELCELMNDQFQMVMAFESGKVVWFNRKE